MPTITRQHAGARFEQPSKTSGFSIVELLIAMTLGLMLTAGMFTIFSGNQRSNALNTELANMQESIRFALSAISEDIRMAGYQGCAESGTGSIDIIADDAPSDDLALTAISGTVLISSYFWQPTAEVGTGLGRFNPPFDVTARTGTHSIALQYAMNPGSGLTGPQMDSNAGTPNASGPLVLERDIEVQTGDLALISTCEAGELFRVTGTSFGGDTMTLEHGEGMNESENFSRIYGTEINIDQTRVMPFTTRIYYVADSKEDRPDGSPLYALYQQTMPFNDPDNPPVMLVEGVENMRVLFGIGAENGELQYVVANDPTYDPQKIRSVRIGLLMASYNTLRETADTNTYMLAGKAITPSGSSTSVDFYPDDKRLRQAFNITETIRNRRASE